MPTLDMEIYTAFNGVQMTIAWADEAEYQAGKEFLIGLGAFDIPFAATRADRPEFIYLETEQQRDALFEFRRSLREKRAARSANTL